MRAIGKDRKVRKGAGSPERRKKEGNTVKWLCPREGRVEIRALQTRREGEKGRRDRKEKGKERKGKNRRKEEERKRGDRRGKPQGQQDF